MRENEVANGVGALDWVFITLEGFEKPGVISRNEVQGLFIGPELLRRKKEKV